MSYQKWQKKKEKAIDEGNLEELYAACIELASLYTSKEELEDALKEFKEAKRAAEASNNTINVAVCHRMIGEVYIKMLNHDLAIKYQHKYLELSRAQGDTVEEQRALANLGHVYFLKADTFANPAALERQKCLEKSESYSRQSLRTCERLTNIINKKELTEMQARLYLNLGLVEEQRGDGTTAVSHFNRAINLCKSMDIWDILCRSYSALAGLHHSQGDHARALDSVDRALAVAARLPDKDQQTCDHLMLKADILFDLPDFRGAKQCLLKAYKLNTENRSDVEKKLKTVAAVSRFEERLLDTPEDDLVTRKRLYESLGDGCAAMACYSRALEYYYLMLTTARDLGESGEQLRPCFVSLSQTYKDNKEYELAIKYLNEELELNKDNPGEACKTTLSIAEVLELKEADVDEITECYQRARSLAQAAGSVKLEIRALESAVQVLKDKSRLTDARKMEAEVENLKEKYGPIDSSSESEEENTPDIGADINIEELSDDEPDPGQSQSVRTRKRCSATKFRRNEKGEYPLHTACINGNLTLVNKLLDQGHPVNVRDHGGWSPLHEACNHGHLEIVSTLLDRGAVVNDRGSDGITPLLDAASCGNLGVVRLLLSKGASPVMRTNKGETVLDCLTGWRQRYKKDMNADLDPEDLADYNDIVRTLRSALKKAGHQAPTERKSVSPPPPQLPDHSSQPSTSRRHSGNGHRDFSSQRPESSRERRSFGEEDLHHNRFSDKDKSRSKPSSSLRRSSDEIPSRKSTNATKEYEEAMKALRRKHTTTSSSESPPHRTEPSALLPADEVVDDWLIDDLAPANTRGVKRRRPHHYEGEPQRRPNRLSSPPSPLATASQHSYRPISPVDVFGDSQEMESVDDVLEISPSISEDVVPLSQDNSAIRHSQSSSNIRLSLPNRHQVPLSAFGVVRMPPPPPPQPTPQMVEVSPPFAMPTAYPPASQAMQLSQSTQMALPSIKVRVEGKLLLIPLPSPDNTQETRTIGWLAEEAARRYYSFEGREPRLTLETEEGAMLSPHDPVTLLLGCREVTGVVTAWKVTKVTDRYREICTEMAVEVDDYVEQVLDSSSFSLSLSDCRLDAAAAEPVLAALATQTTLQHLVLSDNRLGDDGIQLLAKLLPKLPHLRELDISCNGMTSDGLTTLVTQMEEHNACQRLEVLKLSHNRLGKACVSLLSRLLRVTKSLMYLSITSVGLTAASFNGAAHLSLDGVERLEASLNALGSEGVRSLLRGLSVGRVVSLRLAHMGPGAVGEVAAWLARGDPCRLQTLDLAHCHDTDTAFHRLVQNLARAPLLEQLDLSCPPTLDHGSLQTLYQLPLKILRLPGVSVTLPPSAPPPPVHQMSCVCPSSAVTPFWAHQGPFGLMTNNTFNL